ncbi:hypothetical protein MNBD_GAMMA26-1448 [hydrothermal vent metagenome]|uniref:Type IV pilin Tt1218-like domain-containing protein n=1 Tax=hydrothermal vent metagenome TaxID=652676 RepID=A0A3B1AMJ8_9ZZZZ
MMKSKLSKADTNAGFTLIEVLVTLVILGVGLLGMAGMQMTGLQSNQGAYLRSQANFIATDVADRLRANSSELDEYDGFTVDIEAVVLPTSQDCETAMVSCNLDEVADYDMFRWNAMVSDLLPPVIDVDGDNELVINITAAADGKSSEANILIRWTSMGETVELPMVIHIWTI